MEKWIGISRLPCALKNAGADVYILCPKNSYIAKTRFFNVRGRYRTYTYSRSKLVYFTILFFLLRFKSDLIIPGDEEALFALQNLANILSNNPFLSGISRQIRQSIGEAEFDQVRLSKSLFMQACKQWRIRSPQNESLRTIEEAVGLAKQWGYPVVLKSNFGYGASGVSVCQNEAELIEAFLRFTKTSIISKLRAFLKSIFFIIPQGDGLSLQRYIDGSIGLVPFIAYRGQILGANPMLKHRTYPGATGPSSVCKGIDSPEILEMVTQVCKSMRYTGFGSLDFIIDSETDKPYIIELNPRPVPTSHFGSKYCSVDLCDSLIKKMQGKFLPANKFRPFLVALFPNEKKRDPQSPFLKEAFHDVPYDDPALMASLDS